MSLEFKKPFEVFNVTYAHGSHFLGFLQDFISLEKLGKTSKVENDSFELLLCNRSILFKLILDPFENPSPYTCLDIYQVKKDLNGLFETDSIRALGSIKFDLLGNISLWTGEKFSISQINFSEKETIEFFSLIFSKLAKFFDQ